MAKVIVQVTGGAKQEIQAENIGQVKIVLGAQGYTANLNGNPAKDTDSVREYDFVTLAPAVKGAGIGYQAEGMFVKNKFPVGTHY